MSTPDPEAEQAKKTAEEQAQQAQMADGYGPSTGLAKQQHRRKRLKCSKFS
jgi:hypothetical protein